MLNQQHNIVFDSLACKDTNPSAIMMKEGEKRHKGTGTKAQSGEVSWGALFEGSLIYE